YVQMTPLMKSLIAVIFRCCMLLFYGTMDSLQFRSDLVLSDVHLFMPNAHHFMVRLGLCGEQGPSQANEKVEGAEIAASNIPSEPPLFNERCGNESNVGSHIRQCQIATHLFDEDGDLLVTRSQRNVHEAEGRPITQPVILCGHPSVSFEEKEGEKDEEKNDENGNCFPCLQVWRASFLLCDYILNCRRKFNGVTALELGAGTGLVSITMATIASKVYCTDVGTDLLDLCQRNVKEEQQHDYCLNCPENEFSWSEEEVADIHDHTTLLLAADVCYDDDLTDAFFRTVCHLMSNFVNDSMLFIAIEKRYNFTLRTLDVACEAYEYFRHCLKELGAMTDGNREYRICKISTDFPQAMSYDRVKHLVSHPQL
uniref:Methyltransferase like 22 n=1 Tax=Eptatretus burgeri TaxID=7764 RepID=A0A8C4N248_EPTBU